MGDKNTHTKKIPSTQAIKVRPKLHLFVVMADCPGYSSGGPSRLLNYADESSAEYAGEIAGIGEEHVGLKEEVTERPHVEDQPWKAPHRRP